MCERGTNAAVAYRTDRLMFETTGCQFIGHHLAPHHSSETPAERVTTSGRWSRGKRVQASRCDWLVSAGNSTSTGTHTASTWSCCYIQRAPEVSSTTMALRRVPPRDGEEDGAGKARESTRDLDSVAAASECQASPLWSDFDLIMSSSQILQPYV